MLSIAPTLIYLGALDRVLSRIMYLKLKRFVLTLSLPQQKDGGAMSMCVWGV